MSFESFRHPSLRLRILAPAALVAIPAIVLIGFISLDRRQQAERGVTQTAERLASLKARDQERLLEGTRQLLIAASQSRDVREGDVETCSKFFRETIAHFGKMYVNIGALDSKGTLLCAGTTQTGISLADRSYFQRAIATKTFAVGEYAVGRLTGKHSLSVAYPLLSPKGDVQLVTFAAIDLSWLNESLAASDWPSDGSIIVTDRHQNVIAMHPDGEKWLGRSLKSDPITKAIDSRPNGTLEFEEHGQMEVVAFDHVRQNDAGLTVRVSLPKAPATAAANWAMYQNLLAFSLVAFFVILGVRLASNRLLLQPIEQLTSASRRLAAGDLGARVASSTTIPELHELGKDFDAMAAALEEREAARLRAELERKEIEQQYHQAQKMDAVGRLAGGIAHDFNNMLTAILGYCELLLDDPAITDSQRGDIREIERAGRTAAQLTRQLLAFSRREIVEPTVLDLNAIVGSMDKMLHRLVGEHIAMDTLLTPSLHVVKADRGQIEQVILNLTVNARDAMPDGGRISIRTENVDLPEGVWSNYLVAPAGQYVMLSVSDTGTGMTPDVLQHLFEPFFTTKSTGKGTGLGLATVYGIVKQNNGGIIVESAVGGGTLFKIYLPRTTEAVAAVAAPSVQRTTNAKATVLIVEDDAGIRELSSKVLSRYGYDVLSASSGDEARQICERHDGAIHVLLSDVVMPGMNGPMVADMLTKMRPGLKVIFMSGYTDDAIVRHGVMERDVPFLQKPFTPERLANKIGEVLG